ncbi:hypothetical protein M2447_000931 [Ereboglobus sp. PH5-10]|uniref:DUF5682 family protein n=1 Tax=Ereboglobus sp. PH5-10 TaxID=2940629 RepID=UPI0024073EF9|nr:DUF5682 family protein [Ereboglobus sp. PH5-10]MDF9826846.1 hypothetical protein [Ereboglobus sp. PH5-10]
MRETKAFPYADADPRLWSCDGPVVFFPVRHHSPACARFVGELVRRLRPAAVLIEGPSDFNPRLGELLAPHTLPIAIYSYFTDAGQNRRGAFYPFCEFSPEWVALRAAAALKIPAEFIDLPWSETAALDRAANRYADGALGRSSYTAQLCRSLGVDDWDTLWDTLFEIDPALSPGEFLRRCHAFCRNARLADGGASAADLAREAFMLSRICAALARHPRGPVLVVTGGFHSSALFDGLYSENEYNENAASPPDGAIAPERQPRPPDGGHGIALTPYSYERLDSLTGYEAGLVNPGFYHRVWLDHSPGAHAALLAAAAQSLRARGQTASTADLVAVETTAAALATLRGHAIVWRTDLVDALTGALVKEEIATAARGSGAARHPFLDALHAVFRGDARGRLAPGTPLPPLVADIAAALRAHDIEPPSQERRLELALDKPADIARSHTLHRLRILEIPGFARTDGTDFTGRDDLSRLWETWALRWTPDFDAACIERSLYGAALPDAAGARLVENAARIERDADAAARLLLDAALAGWHAGFARLRARVIELLRADASFVSVARALGHLYYLYRYNDSVATAAAAARDEIAALLTESHARAIWLLEAQAPAADEAAIKGLRALLAAVHTAGKTLAWDTAGLVATLRRLCATSSHPPLLRGGAAGALWSLGETGLADILGQIPSAPDKLGDFLQGVFALAREESQRHPDLLLAIDRHLLAYDTEMFLAALPALRLAFTYFTPREKDHLARRLLEATGATAAAPLPALAVSPAAAARALAFESRLQQELARHGLRAPLVK